MARSPTAWIPTAAPALMSMTRRDASVSEDGGPPNAVHYDPTNGTLIHIDTGNGQSQSFVYDGSLLLESGGRESSPAESRAPTATVSRPIPYRERPVQYPFEYDADSSSRALLTCAWLATRRMGCSNSVHEWKPGGNLEPQRFW